jgi:hypothetical protein
MVFTPFLLTLALRVVDQFLEVKYGKRTPGDPKSATPASTATSPTVPKPSTSPKSPNSLAPPTPTAGGDGISSEGETSPRTPKVSVTQFLCQSLTVCSLIIQSAKKSKKRK